MGLQIFTELPKANGDLVQIQNLPIIVTPNEAFHEAKATLLALVEQAGTLANSIQTDEQYDEGIKVLQGINRFLKDLEAGFKPPKDEANRFKDTLMGYYHELTDPGTKLKTAVSAETGRYFQDRERRRREEEERLRREAELERQRKQREADLNALRAEINAAKMVADAAGHEGHPELAAEIRGGLKRFAAIESAPGAYKNPLQDATGVRQVVALALQREQARVAAEKARQDGDKATAKAIEKAAAKLEAPEVAQVVSERIEAAPVVVPREELTKAKGAYVKEFWRVSLIVDPTKVPREFCEPSESRLNDYAKRLGKQPVVPGVVFEREVKIAGIRS